jgi:hypothetical protein
MTIFPQYEEQLRELARRESGLAPSGARGRLTRRRGALAIGLPVAVAVAVAGLVIVLGGHRRVPMPAAGPPRPAWLTRLATHFSILRGPTTTPPAAIAQRFRSLEADDVSSNLALTHRIRLPQGTLWVLPGRDMICIVLAVPGRVGPELGGDCAGTQGAVTHGTEIFVGGLRNPAAPPGPGNPLRATIGGLVPDGTLSVLISRSTAPTVSAAVTDNAFAARTTARITSTRNIRGRPPFPTNAAGETFGSAGGARAGRVRTGDIPDLIIASGRSLDGVGRVTGFVRRAQLDAHSCANVRTPKQAVHCSQHAKPTTIPIVAINGRTVIGRFRIGN